MAITINRINPLAFNVKTLDMQDGRAYLDEDGYLFICNKYQDVIASSVSGNHVVTTSNGQRFREVNIEITVTEL